MEQITVEDARAYVLAMEDRERGDNIVTYIDRDGETYVNMVISEDITLSEYKELEKRTVYVYDELEETIYNKFDDEVREVFRCEEIEAEYDFSPYVKFRIDKLRAKEPFAYVIMYVQDDFEEYAEYLDIIFREERSEIMKNLKEKNPTFSDQMLMSMAEEYIFFQN